MAETAFIECSRCRQRLSAAEVPQKCPRCNAEFYTGNELDAQAGLNALDREAAWPKRTPVGGIITPQ